MTVGAGPGTAGWAGTPLRLVSLPPGTLVALVRRNGSDIVPNGSTVLRSGDQLTLLGDAEELRLADRALSGEGLPTTSAGR